MKENKNKINIKDIEVLYELSIHFLLILFVAPIKTTSV